MWVCLKCGHNFDVKRKGGGSAICRRCKSGKYVVSTLHPLALSAVERVVQHELNRVVKHNREKGGLDG